MKKVIRKKWGRAELTLEPAELPDCIVVDAMSILIPFSDWRSVVVALAQRGALFVVDYSKEWHRRPAAAVVKFIREVGGRYVLAERRDAEAEAVAIACRQQCDVLTRDADALLYLDQDCKKTRVYMFLGGRLYVVADYKLYFSTS